MWTGYSHCASRWHILQVGQNHCKAAHLLRTIHPCLCSSSEVERRVRPIPILATILATVAQPGPRVTAQQLWWWRPVARRSRSWQQYQRNRAESNALCLEQKLRFLLCENLSSASQDQRCWDVLHSGVRWARIRCGSELWQGLQTKDTFPWCHSFPRQAAAKCGGTAHPSILSAWWWKKSIARAGVCEVSCWTSFILASTTVLVLRWCTWPSSVIHLIAISLFPCREREFPRCNFIAYFCHINKQKATSTDALNKGTVSFLYPKLNHDHQ